MILLLKDEFRFWLLGMVLLCNRGFLLLGNANLPD